MKSLNKYTQKSLGIGLTSKCNLDCPHCYSKNLTKKTISLKTVRSIVKKFPNLKKVNFGTGESILNPELPEIIDFFHSKNIKIALTSNGITVDKLSDEYLLKINEVDISIDFPNRRDHDSWRKKEGVFDVAIGAIERCKKLGVEVSIAATLMNINHSVFRGFKKILDKYNIYLRVNLYKPVNSNEYSLSYDQFWKAIGIIADNFTLVSNSEPIISLTSPLSVDVCGSPCGDSVRLHPDLSISPCVYVDGNKVSVEKFNKLKKIIPDFCTSCKFLEKCQGGCMSRRILEDRIYKPDSYCPIYKENKAPDIEFGKVEKKNFIHSNYLCTFILK